MNDRTIAIQNDIMRAVMDYISEHENDKIPTKNFTKLGQALNLIRSILEDHTQALDAALISVFVSYAATDATIVVTLPSNWSFDKKALKVWKKLMQLVDEMAHQTGPLDEEQAVPTEDRLCFVIRDVFEA